MKPERTIIVGGGVGGMALAAALGRLGFPFVLLEQAPELGEVGSGLGVMPGAVRALETLGVSASLFESAAPFRRFVTCTHKGEDLAELRFSRVFERAGRPGYVMHRGALHAALTARVSPEAIRTSATVESVEERNGRVSVFLRGEEAPITGDLLIGADGLNSVVRRYVVADGRPRYAGETIFRGITPLTLAQPEICREIFGEGRRCAYYDLGGGRVYWWATAPLAQGTIVPQWERHGFLADRFAGWSYGVLGLFAGTPEASILQNDIYDRKPAPRWHRGRVGLLGDAAHPTTPNLGQGACMAIEDAIVLARSLVQAQSSEQGFERFHQSRRRRASQTVAMSRLWGRAGMWTNPALVAMRNGAFRYARPSWLEAIASSQYGYDPGGLPERSGS